jgi:hypothetical protein
MGSDTIPVGIHGIDMRKAAARIIADSFHTVTEEAPELLDIVHACIAASNPDDRNSI